MDDLQKEKSFQQVNAWIQEAVSALGAGQLGKARELFLKVTETAPSFADAYYNLGVICDLEKKPDDAIKFYVKTLKYNPKHAECLTNMGAAHSNAGRHGIAIPFLTRAVESNPLLIQPRLNLGITYRHMEQPEKALEALKGAVGVEPRNAYALYLAGCAAQEAGFNTESARFLEQALDIKPTYTDALIVLVDVLLELEMPEHAIEILETFIANNPNNETAKECLRRIR